MIKETRKTIIGGFVAGAVALGIAGVLIFGSGDFFKETNTYVLYFKDSVKGLKIGAPVLFRGVEIGKVTQIILNLNAKDLSVEIPVLMEENPSAWNLVGESDMGVAEAIEMMTKQGIRASLEMQSLVTGLYVIQLDYHPDEPAVFRATDTTYPEIPTIETGISKFSKKLQDLPIEELFEKLTSLINSADKIVNTDASRAIPGNINAAIQDARKLMGEVNGMVSPLGTSYIHLADNAEKSVTKMTRDISDTAKAYKTLALDLDKQVDPLAAEIRKTAESLRHGVVTAQSTLESAKALISNDSPVFIELTKTLKELSSAARSIRVWADYLERHPEALIKGKGRR